MREVKLVSLRYGLNITNALIQLGNNYHFNTDEQKLYNHDKSIELTKQELALMQVLIKNIGETVSLEAIEVMLWYDKMVNESSRRQLLFRLKSKVQGLTIESIKGIGYKLHRL